MALVARLCRRSSIRRSSLLHGGSFYNAYMGSSNTAGEKRSLSLTDDARSITYNCSPSYLAYYSTDSDRADHRAGEISVKTSNTPTRHGGGRGQSRRSLLWSNPWDLVPFSFNNRGRFGNVLEHMSGNLNQLFQNLVPSRILGRLKEDDKRYKLQYEVPGFSKEDLKITIDKGFLTNSGEHQEEEGDESDHDDYDEEEEDGYWHGSRYRC
ncbi:26.5 kDa heat shock protein, mitochondrial-like [Dioscorea cayenensis subsp. rotundata]|uniref:26.5 kDa heat shock protein, mitochondrial-like n=1 Tax=Dioscorea cayennensis subsp. rotundata TaxID=55577 RepID=A0AB40CSV8_DIOCR|nr:26.5 kDa heat shock protein, mitochondrial-like [Dioscorea cayenensis subsp. rotundata]